MKIVLNIPDILCTKWSIGATCVVTFALIWLAYLQSGNSGQSVTSNGHKNLPGNAVDATGHPRESPGTTERPGAEQTTPGRLLKPFVPQPGILNSTRPNPVIMCLIFTMPSQWDIKGLAVKLTWAKRCDYYAFFYSKKDNMTLRGAYGLDVPEGRDHLTAKTMKALQVSYTKYGQVVDWFLKADDDTYVIVENLRALAALYDPTKGVYLGHTSYEILSRGYNSGGAGYLLSTEAVRLMVEQGDMYPSYCSLDGGTEDLDIGKCLQAFRIFPAETRDSSGRITFHPDHPVKLLDGEPSALDVYTYSKFNYTFGNYKGIRVLSPLTISLHYVDVGHMYMYDFLLYELLRDRRK